MPIDHNLDIIGGASAPQGGTVHDLLTQRAHTHGDFAINSRISQEIKHLTRGGRTAGAPPLTRVQQEALDMIAHKIGRIIAGDPNHRDHWQDIAGYAQLVVDRL